MQARITLLPGDGVGAEVCQAARAVLTALARDRGWDVGLEEAAIGWTAVRATGSPLPRATLDACLASDAVFLGAVGSPEADDAPAELRPEAGLLALRRKLSCWANLRPLRLSEGLVAASPLRPERLRGVDLILVRELGGGLYYGEPRGQNGQRGWNTLVYERDEVARITRCALRLARTRRRRVTSVDKANVLEASRLWRTVVDEVTRAEGEGIELEHMLVDRAAMELVLHPARFDVVLTSNLFGDILSDELGAVAGSLGVLGSASLGDACGLYEPVHGSAPDLAGRGLANPVGALESVALMLRHSFQEHEAGAALEAAVDAALSEGVRTPDLASAHGCDPVDTASFTRDVIERLHAAPPGSPSG